MPDSTYRRLFDELKTFIPESRLAADPLRTLAYGTDASCYRLIPKIVVRADTEADVCAILRQTAAHHVPVTFRAAGTSLSGQAISDAPLTECPACHKPELRKRVSAAGFQLKGSGWYVTDFRDKSAKKDKAPAADAAKTNGKAEGAADSAKTESTSTDKTASSTESKATTPSTTKSDA